MNKKPSYKMTDPVALYQVGTESGDCLLWVNQATSKERKVNTPKNLIFVDNKNVFATNGFVINLVSKDVVPMDNGVYYIEKQDKNVMVYRVLDYVDFPPIYQIIPNSKGELPSGEIGLIFENISGFLANFKSRTTKAMKMVFHDKNHAIEIWQNDGLLYSLIMPAYVEYQENKRPVQ